MANNPFFSARIPQSLYDAIENHREQTGESKTDVLIKALSAYVNHTIEKPELMDKSRFESLEERVAQIERALNSIQLQGESEPIQGDIFGSNDDFFKNACEKYYSKTGKAK